VVKPETSRKKMTKPATPGQVAAQEIIDGLLFYSILAHCKNNLQQFFLRKMRCQMVIS